MYEDTIELKAEGYDYKKHVYLVTNRKEDTIECGLVSRETFTGGEFDACYLNDTGIISGKNKVSIGNIDELTPLGMQTINTSKSIIQEIIVELTKQ